MTHIYTILPEIENIHKYSARHKIFIANILSGPDSLSQTLIDFERQIQKYLNYEPSNRLAIGLEV